MGKITHAILSVLRDMIENDSKGMAAVVVGVVSVFFGLLLLIIMPVVLHERVPTVTKEQAVWYWQAAKEVTEMTQSPCDPGVYVDWQQVIAVDTVKLKQNFKKASLKRARELALHYVEQIGTCTH